MSKISMSNATPALIANTTVHDLVPAQGGAPWRIFLHVPSGPVPEAGWPVLYMTDGNAVIGTAVDAMRAQAFYPTGTNVGWGVIVAIGYPVDGAYDPLRRSWDLGPPPGKTYPPFYEGTSEVRTGGAGKFLAFIEDELKPWVASRVTVDASRHALYGHSFGGLFALYALFARPSSFQTWIAASPAIYWEDRVIDRFLEAFEAAIPDGLAATMILSAGEYETEKLAQFQIGAEDEEKRLKQKKVTRTDAFARAMAQRLDALPGVRASFELHAGENHMSILPVTVNRAVQAAFAVRRDAALC
ncbi:alpha/beta hydrolase [Mesorhizobium sp. M7A.F.Ca.CA.001.09.2.1]|uniref:Alpha/beta hydrolase n=2 Tax=Mesorhizobium TaxID=68287 RepID=A0AB38TB92_9HYPH|nr:MULTISPECIES: alpha/beta hydrolase-fold protein [Mesorhizobium]RUY25889.1 alpha/beta hydrolase [Mesorhizobium sp. M7A.F.Ca.CA.001.13.2.1]MDF3214845.1 alpha/beta hydrolase-fold protein [Mesorhizobium ciceri]RUY69969.1 alpha/beta hydrolase [Mesorhizobium sp. M7A.F.Ca.CA.001.05.1.1]RUY71764.1 alpha/beta hydrolase [Mesorhizobium sp. M7A.F.Ca.CA.001.13.1.1]RUY81293.1 alpha/beta hydrolase [Mesorhizobium sp. M7A.F.Ca.CA.001.09.2.1]